MGLNECRLRNEYHIQQAEAGLVEAPVDEIKGGRAKAKPSQVLRPEQVAQLKLANEHIRCALENSTWSQWMRNSLSVPYDAGELPRELRETWSDSKSDTTLISGNDLVIISESNLPGNTVGRIIIEGNAARLEKDIVLGHKPVIQRVASAKEGGSKKKPVIARTGAASAAPSSSGLKKAITAPRAKETVRSHAEALEIGHVDGDEEKDAEDNEFAPNHTDEIPLPVTIQSRAHSSKINFVLQAILSSPPDDKFVVFGDKADLEKVMDALVLAQLSP
jgi:hypothetical protein